MVELGLEEMTATFDGSDPLKPAHRNRLLTVLRELEQLVECLPVRRAEIQESRIGGQRERLFAQPIECLVERLVQAVR